MDKDKLKRKEEIQAFLDAITKGVGSQSADYSAPEEVKKDAIKPTKEKLDSQKPKHRTSLLVLVFVLTISSFLLLAGVVIFQMWKRLNVPEYSGVSDSVINILAGGVFAELVGVVAIIAKLVWKDPS